MEHWTEYSRFITALFVLLDPFAAVPIYLLLTKSYTPEEKKRISYTASLTVCIILILAAIMGESLLHGIGTSLASFRVGGGIVLLLMALAMLQGKMDTMPVEQTSPQEKGAIAIVPLAMPLLAGPGSISTVIIEMHRSTLEYHSLMVILSIILVCLALWLILYLASSIGKMLGPIGLNIINRIFGLILTAIAVEIMANGLKQLFPVLAS